MKTEYPGEKISDITCSKPTMETQEQIFPVKKQFLLLESSKCPVRSSWKY